MASKSRNHGALVVFGSGPGIGRNVGGLFAERGFQKVVLLSRNAERLQEDAKFVKSNGADAAVDIVQIDLADVGNLSVVLKEVDNHLRDVPLEAVLFNAARVGPSKLWEFSHEELESDLKISVISLYVVAQWAMPQLVKNTGDDSHDPLFLVTSGMLAKDPFPALFSLATSKAAQYSLVHSLYKEYLAQGVHCALLVVGGRVADESKVTNARNVAEEAWKLFQQPKGKGELEKVMLDPDYMAHIKKREQDSKKT